MLHFDKPICPTNPTDICKAQELRLAEIELMRQRERGAELHRDLPQGASIQDYAFQEGPSNLDAGDTPIRTVRLSELFSAPDRPLVVYHFMFGKKRPPRAQCAHWFSTVGMASRIIWLRTSTLPLSPPPIRKRCDSMHARAAGTDCGSSVAATYVQIRSRERRPRGQSGSTVSVFTRDHDGTLRHFCTAHPSLSSDIKERGLDLLCPVYHVLDLTPQGRGDWYADLGYGTDVSAPRR